MKEKFDKIAAYIVFYVGGPAAFVGLFALGCKVMRIIMDFFGLD